MERRSNGVFEYWSNGVLESWERQNKPGSKLSFESLETLLSLANKATGENEETLANEETEEK